ncbi:NUDIX domain-containing protein [Candidatus Pacearchaeota archaeon]|nr:NUDIX domain-containing protein [Candidatus Pacearchaeota archaeon]
MDDKTYYGVGLVITNPGHTDFYLQQKDDTYWIEEYRLHYTFFGGAIEDDETETQALKRELLEELGPKVTDMIYEGSKRIADLTFINVLNKKFNYTLYESVIPDNDLKSLSNVKVMEGKGGFLIPRDKIEIIPLFRTLKPLLQKYLLRI